MKTLLSIAISLLTLSVSAQITTNSQWTWMKGDSTVNQSGVYGTKGVADILNNPPGRDLCNSWQDASGNLWLFGGAENRSPQTNNYNDLWKYDPTNQWIWVSGDSSINQTGVYGTKGTPSVSNKPGARSAVATWKDASGNLWLFGGGGWNNSFTFIFNDLWKYNIATNQWTWVNGDAIVNQLSVYGTQGMASSTNKPGGRWGSTSWTDASGNFWLFGGFGYDGVSAYPSMLNDLWKYNPTTNKWTWVKGNNIIDQPGVYGTQGVSAVANNPGAREDCPSWIDGSGNFWLFGGYGYDTVTGWNGLNDLWKYNPSTNQWTWVKGDNTNNQPGIYGTQGIASLTNKPGARYWGLPWTDASGNLWLFGGVAYDINNGQYKHCSDLWKYNAVSNQWTWIKGDSALNQVAIYGVKGIAAATNNPGARAAGVCWKDGSSNFWLFGGGLTGNPNFVNDIWKLGKDGFVWIGITSTDWTVGSNWSGGVVPGINDNATIPSGTAFNATVPAGVTTSVRSLNNRGAGILRN
jgi:N-acetylneuraminic acid mutarotase